MDPRDLQSFLDGLRDLDASERIRPAGATGRLATYHLSSPVGVTNAYDALGSVDAAPLAVRRDPRDASVRVDLDVANRGTETFRLPDPISPEDLTVRWHDADGRVVRSETARALLPMALAAGARFPVTLRITPPSQPGRYVIDVARPAAPEQILARRTIDLDPTS
jgi:hypothetical protein